MSSGVYNFDDTPEEPVDPPVDPPPAMPATAPAGWSRQSDTDFDIVVPKGGLLLAGSGYSGSASADDRGRMQFGAYTWSSFKDTRSKSSHSTTITVTVSAGSKTITSSGQFTADNFCYAGKSGTGPSPFGGSYIELSGVFPAGTRFLAVNSISSAQLTQAALVNGTYTVTTKSDFGYYDERNYSIADGILTLEIGTDGNGLHHVGALNPKLNGVNTGRSDVLGGAFEYCMQVPTPIPTYKMAPLLWPITNSSSNGGEIDFPETGLDGTDLATGYTHFHDNSGQFINSTTVDVVGTGWHRYRIEWRPYGGPGGTDVGLTTVKYFLDGVKQGSTRIGSVVPHNAMHWIWQVETDLNYTSPIDDLAAGTVKYAWALFDNPVGIVTDPS